MKILRIIVLLLFVCGTLVNAQELSYPIDTINGKLFYRYIVEKGVGLFRISRIFNTTQELILKANQNLSQGLVWGDTIFIPIASASPTVNKAVSKQENSSDVVPVEDLLQVKRNMDEDLSMQSLSDTLRLALMLPLHASATKRNISMERFMDFYTGALIAVFEAQKTGQYIEVYTFDIEKTNDRLHDILSDSLWRPVDAVIGPAYAQQVQKMIEFTQRDSTWLLIPFVSEIHCEHHNPFVFQFNPSVQTEANAFAEYLSLRADSINCVLIQPKDGEMIPKSIQSIHSALKQYNISTTTTTIRNVLSDSIDDALVADKENIVIFNTEKYNNLQAVIPHLLHLVGKYNVTLFSRYSWQNEKIVLPQIYTSVFKEENMYMEDYENLYKMYFEAIPSSQHPRYDLLGYDLTKHLIYSLLDFNAEMYQKLWNGVQTEIQYKTASTHAGYENVKINIIRK